MAIEDEVKLDVPLDFLEPSIAPGDEIDEIELLPEVRTVTIYFDTADAALQAAKIALRFRYRVSAEKFPGEHDPLSPPGDQEGIWATKTKGQQVESEGVTSIERQEVEVRSTFSEFPVAALGEMALSMPPRGDLAVIAAMDARRNSRRIVSSAKAVVQIDDDTVRVIAGPASGDVFREIEFELADPGFASVRSRLVESFIAAGAKYSAAGSKLERALGMGR